MKKRKGFQIGFSIYMLLLAGLCVFFLGYVWNTMEKFQSMQPDGEMKKLIKEITVEDMDFNQVQQPSAFEDENILKLKMQEKLDGAELSFEQRQGGYDAKAPVFDVYAGEELLYTVTLAEKEEVRLMAILSASVWETASIIPNVEIGEYQVDVTVPDNYTVTVNGITVEEGLCETVKIPLEELAYSAEYVAVPGLVSYHIAGLVEEPTVEIFDRNGEKVSLPAGERSIVIDSFPAEKMPEELFRMALGAAETYSNYFSVDLEGAKKSTAPIRPLFPESSYYLEMAENYRRHDMWMYSEHDAPVFSSEKVSNYTVYSDDLFSCEISFEKTMRLAGSGAKRVDTVHDIYYFVKIDGKWLISDIRAVIE